MTEKPYDVINKAEPRGQSVTYEGIPCTARTCVTRLNRLTEENEQLQQRNKRLQEKIQRERASSTKQHLKWSKEAEEQIQTLKEEIEQLKSQLKDYHNAFDCSQCKYQNYDWFDDGDEFEVCDKGNNEAQMEYHSCKDWEEL